MSSLGLLSVYLSGASLILLLSAVSEAQYYELSPAPDYDDYNATFEYSFYSNTSSEDLDKFSERFIDEEEAEEEDTGGQREEEDVTVTMTTTRGTTEQGEVDGRSAASLSVSLEIRTLVWTLMILISLNMQQLQHTL
ncbi:uncharacterized protein si:ch211-191i18.2 [Sebastes umbrosus]|uniref:uncharacterized protein si:ch211-191i18.2 n=1 Tax=Sebastes umbrosus TaxID=72105 RepID=UPI00189E9358|nr:uncharacterized protein si:ch211-191i18.2 [Sebastes umbrosus]